MFVQVTLQRKRFTATLADVRFAVRMCLHVRSQVGLIRERLGADRAVKWFLSRVRSDVPLQEPGTREALAAVRTLAALAVRAYVHAVSRHRHVHLIAVRTLAGFLVRDAPVCLTVTR